VEIPFIRSFHSFGLYRTPRLVALLFLTSAVFTNISTATTETAVISTKLSLAHAPHARPVPAPLQNVSFRTTGV
jgi:hypothetical protein